jgi:hypothetical protein
MGVICSPLRQGVRVCVMACSLEKRVSSSGRVSRLLRLRSCPFACLRLLLLLTIEP